MKAFTDIEQSKKLTEILPIESADMSYVKAYFDGKQSDWFIQAVKPIKFYDVIPAWSLAALLSVFQEVDNNTKFWSDHKGWHLANAIYEVCLSNPVDACVEMIIKLKENNLL